MISARRLCIGVVSIAVAASVAMPAGAGAREVTLRTLKQRIAFERAKLNGLYAQKKYLDRQCRLLAKQIARERARIARVHGLPAHKK